MEKLKDSFQNFSPEQRRALLLPALAGIGFALFLLFASRGEAVEAPPLKVIDSTAKKTLFVHVAGEVKRPGVYPVVQGSRVVDAIKAAGGAKVGIDLSQVNLARVLVDGEQIYLSKESPVKVRTGKAKPKVFSGVVHVNRASVAEFDSLDGIGPVIAKRIVKYRESNGPFVDIADLQKVDGIGAKTFEKIKERLSL
ncbi:MAG: helix-hairpin-helix domain-containing protein [Actinomycetales bacterium]